MSALPRTFSEDEDSEPTLLMDRTPMSGKHAIVAPVRAGLRFVDVAHLSPAAAAPAFSEPALDETQPARRRQTTTTLRATTTLYRRVAILFAIAFAFALGSAASFGLQLASWSGARTARPPRDAVTRSASLRRADGAESKAVATESKSAAAESKTVATEGKAVAARTTRTSASPVRHANGTAAPTTAAPTTAASTAAASTASVQAAPKDTESTDFAVTNILGDGLASD